MKRLSLMLVVALVANSASAVISDAKGEQILQNLKTKSAKFNSDVVVDLYELYDAACQMEQYVSKADDKNIEEIYNNLNPVLTGKSDKLKDKYKNIAKKALVDRLNTIKSDVVKGLSKCSKAAKVNGYAAFLAAKYPKTVKGTKIATATALTAAAVWFTYKKVKQNGGLLETGKSLVNGTKALAKGTVDNKVTNWVTSTRAAGLVKSGFKNTFDNRLTNWVASKFAKTVPASAEAVKAAVEATIPSMGTATIEETVKSLANLQ